MATNAALLTARLLLALLFLASALYALGDLEGTTGYFSSLGFPVPSIVAWATCYFELAAGILIVAGFQTRVAALLLAAFCVAAAFIGHYEQGGEDPMLVFMHQQAFLKDLAIAGGLLALAAAGAGGWSIDGRRR